MESSLNGRRNDVLHVQFRSQTAEIWAFKLLTVSTTTGFDIAVEHGCYGCIVSQVFQWGNLCYLYHRYNRSLVHVRGYSLFFFILIKIPLKGESYCFC